jgi:predicted Holliday junction resolvase-like endonuclease
MRLGAMTALETRKNMERTKRAERIEKIKEDRISLGIRRMKTVFVYKVTESVSPLMSLS